MCAVLFASAYQTPPSRLPVTESTPLRNPYWQYSRDKIACEDLLVAEYRSSGFPVTIVRPSHTYDATKTVLSGGWTSLARMLAGKPVIVHGDGTSLWTVTWNEDFARGFVPCWGIPGRTGRRATVPFERGAREIADWYLADPARQVVDPRLDALMDKLAETYGA
jgi:nucleoside-diphosphate-sugar epimerase